MATAVLALTLPSRLVVGGVSTGVDTIVDDGDAMDVEEGDGGEDISALNEDNGEVGNVVEVVVVSGDGRSDVSLVEIILESGVSELTKGDALLVVIIMLEDNRVDIVEVEMLVEDCIGTTISSALLVSYPAALLTLQT